MLFLAIASTVLLVSLLVASGVEYFLQAVGK